MTRTTNIAVAVSLASAAALIGVRFLAPAPSPDASIGPAVGRNFGPQGMQDRKLPPSHVGLSGGAADDTKAPPGAPPGPETRRDAGGSHAGSGRSTELAVAAEQRRDVLAAARRGGGSAANIPVDGSIETALAERNGAVPQAPHANARDANLPAPSNQNKDETFELADSGAKPGTPGDVTLSMPLNGEVKVEVGDTAVQSDGLVSKGGSMEFPDNAQMSFPAGDTVNNKAGTISFDVQPDWAGSDQTNNSLLQIRDEHTWENTLQIVKNFDSLRYIIIDSAGAEHDVNIPISDWAAGQQQHVTATWDDSTMSLYVGGQLVGQNELPNPLNFSQSTPVHVGSDFPGTSYSGADATLGGLKIYGRALGPTEIGMP